MKLDLTWNDDVLLPLQIRLIIDVTFHRRAFAILIRTCSGVVAIAAFQFTAWNGSLLGEFCIELKVCVD
jgi:hypothetical protein